MHPRGLDVRQDGLFSLVQHILQGVFLSGQGRGAFAAAVQSVETLVSEWREQGLHSKLAFHCPDAGPFHTPLPLAAAVPRVELRHGAWAARRFVAPTLQEVRELLNEAQLMASVKEGLRLVTFDGDETLYRDSANISSEPIIAAIVDLLKLNVNVAVVTAAGFPEPDHYMTRLAALLATMAEDSALTDEQVANFLVMGGECNYLYRAEVVRGGGEGTTRSVRLVTVEPSAYKTEEMLAWGKHIPVFLQHARSIMEKRLVELGVDMDNTAFKTKEFALGHISKDRSKAPPGHVLDDLALSVQYELRLLKDVVDIPFCAFNGGKDVWVDVGNKGYGIEALAKYLGGIAPAGCMHFGDQMTVTGNDIAARRTSTTIWVDGPEDTASLLETLVSDLRAKQQQA